MKSSWLFLLMVGVGVVCSSQSVSGPPRAAVKPVVDDYFGKKIADPYRYMEDLSDPTVESWVKAQDQYTRAELDRIPGREKLLARVRELNQSAPEFEAVRLPEDQYLVIKRLPTESIRKLYLRRGTNGTDQLLVDPEKIALAPVDQGKGATTIMDFAVSNDGKWIAVGVDPGGDELHGEIHVFEVATGHETGDTIPQVGAEAWYPYWLPDDHSFVYGRLQKLPPGAPAVEVRQKFRAYLHVMGTNQEKDRPVFGYGIVPSIEVDPSLIASIQTQPDSAWAIGVLNHHSVTPNGAYYIAPAAEVGKPNPVWRKVNDFADDVKRVAVHGDDLYLLTYKNAPRYQVVRTNARRPDLSSAEVIVPPSEAVITSIDPAKDALYVELMDGGVSRILRTPYGPHPKPQAVPLPFSGSAFLDTDPRLPGAFVHLTSWIKGLSIYRYDPKTGQATDTHLQPSGPYDNPANIEAIEVKVHSHDGTLVPLSIAYPKNLKRDGSNPTLLIGYGGYGHSMTPEFLPITLAWYELGGVRAVCHVRGGGEYGEEWHLAGKGATKPNTWLDFIACAQYLIENRYTSPNRLGGVGGSYGGILIGRALTTRPDLFAAAIDQVGASDMLRMELNQNGATNIPESGTVKIKEQFEALLQMSAYHNIKDDTAYPAVLLETGINDPRVDPWQMAKMTARLQAASSSGKPVLLRVDFAGGHGSLGATGDQTNLQHADEWSFLLWQFGVPEFQPK